MEDYLTQITNYLLTQSWQIAALILVIAAVNLALKNRSSHVRYLLWLIVLAKCLVPPFLTVPVAILPQETAIPVLETVDTTAAESPTLPSVPVTTPPAPTVTERPARLTPRQWLGFGWVVGVAAFVIFAVTKALRTNFWLWRQRKPLPPELQSQIRSSFSAVGLGTRPKAGLIQSSPTKSGLIRSRPSAWSPWPKVWLLDGIGQPFVWGLLRGSIYLPGDFVKVNSAEHHRGVLGHELGHILRFDAAVNILQIIAQGIFWFHPFVWWANRKIRAEREKCCDEMAIAHLGAKAKDYSDAIVNILICEHESTRPVPSLAVAGPVKNIEERIKTMLRPGKKFYKHPSLPAVAIVVLTALLAVPTTVVLTVRAENQPSTDSTGAAPIFGNPTSLGPMVNSSAYEWDPAISADGLSLYFKSYRPGGFGSADIWVTTRKTKKDLWGTSVNLGPIINSSHNEGAPDISADGLSLYFISGRPGGSGSWDIWMTTRKSKDEPWGTPVNLGPKVNSSALENGPSISSDCLSLYFSSRIDTADRPSFGSHDHDIWVTTRKTKDEPWGTPVNLGRTVNTSALEGGPSVSGDGLSLYFNSKRPGGFGERDIWVTTRKTKNDPWDTPVNLGPTVNSPDGENNPDISSDGSTLYFIGPDVDIWQVSLKAHGAKE